MLKGKTALITGGSRGIGKAIALALAEAGASVAILYAGNQEAAEQTVSQLKALGAEAEAYQCDIASFDQTGTIVKEVAKRFGQLDILVNNAGITKDGLILTMKEEDFSKVIDTNLKGVFNMIKHVSAIYLRQKKGTIINIASVSGMMGNPGQINYSAAKAGVIGMTKTVAKELAARGITCNAIAPGFIATDMTAALPEKALEQAQAAIPLRRMGTPEDVAATAVFLASPAAAYITGEIIKVDGGLYI